VKGLLETKSTMEIGYESLAITDYRNLFPHYIFLLVVTATHIQTACLHKILRRL